MTGTPIEVPLGIIKITGSLIGIQNFMGMTVTNKYLATGRIQDILVNIRFYRSIRKDRHKDRRTIAITAMTPYGMNPVKTSRLVEHPVVNLYLLS